MKYHLSTQYIKHIKSTHHKVLFISGLIVIALGYLYALHPHHRFLLILPVLIRAFILFYQGYKLCRWHNYARLNTLEIDPARYTLTHTLYGKARVYLLVDIDTISTYKTNRHIHKLRILFNDNTRLDLSHYTPLDQIACELKADLKWHKRRKQSHYQYDNDKEIKLLPHS